MSDWPCRLGQFPDGSEQNVARRHSLDGEWSSNGPAGLYIKTEEGVTIGYSNAQLDKPSALVATLAHELCHYLLKMAARSHPPGGWQDHELHTDTACGFMGFGIFACNAVFDFQQWGDHQMSGWKWSRQGYLSESEHSYSLALYCALTGIDAKTASAHLKNNPREYFEMALDDISHRPAEMDRLLRVKCLPRSLPPILSIESESDASVDSAPDSAAVFTRMDVEELGPTKPWYAPLWDFYMRLASAQAGECWHDKEFAAMDLLQPALRHAVLAMRFTLRFDDQGLQGAIILEEADEPARSEQMLQETIQAFEALRDCPRARFLQMLLPGIAVHFAELERAEREETLDEFFSPLDQDEAWRGLDLLWNHELRRMIRDKPMTFVHPAG
ncbi:MAG: hypothetical protein U1A53_25130 [Prosthecobacter sp.]|nr:hypothetical protein [Prosthecobacter sp.]